MLPAVIKQVDEKQAMAIAISENLVREDLGLVDEAKAASKFVGLNNGDKKEAARMLGWPEAKVKSRLVLMQCSDQVLDALETRKIKLGHAEILSQFTHKLQAGTLEKILDEGWTVEYLKERANKANRLLSTAKFDVDSAGCNSCSHNSSHQAALFDSHVGKAKCGNLVCFKKKTDEWLEGRKKELEADHGTVLIATDKPQEQRNTVSVEVVGKDQFETGCTGCAENIVILTDGINSDCGSLEVNQCIGLDCFSKCVKKHKDSQKALSAPKPAPNSATAQPDSGKVAGKAQNEQKVKTVVEKKTSPAVKESFQSFLREVAAKELLQTKTYKLGTALVSTTEISGYKPEIEGWPKHGYSQQILFCLTQPAEVLSEALTKSIEYLATKTADDSRKNHTETMINCFFKTDKEAERKVRDAWQPSEKALKVHTKTAIELICKEAGLDKAFDIANGDGAFKKLTGSSKPDLIKGVLGFKFAWNNYAPSECISLLK